MSDFIGKRYSAEEVSLLFNRQKAKRWLVAKSSAKERVKVLKELLKVIKEETPAICQAINADFGKHPDESRLTEVLATQEELHFTIKHLAHWMRPLHVPTPLVLFGSKSHVQYEAKGNVLIFSPWNYPFNLAINPLIAAVAAGNCVILRPSDKSPETAKIIQKIITRVFPEDEVAVVLGDRAMADALLDLPFDHFFFTGSPKVGQKVMTAAAKHFASVTLELGGKSPVIVDKSANLEQAAKRLTWGKFINAGQTCVAPDYLLLDEKIAAKFLPLLQKNIRLSYGESPEVQLKSPSLASLVNVASGERLAKLIDASVKSGAQVYYGGEFSSDHRRLSPTIVTAVTPDMALMSEEIFGPILPVITYSDIGEVTALIESRPKPLALYLFANDQKVIKRIYSETTSGGSCLNNTILHLVNSHMPFGGVGMSGLGNYHGEYGFKNMSHERAILVQGAFNSIDYIRPPYGEKKSKLINLMMQIF